MHFTRNANSPCSDKYKEAFSISTQPFSHCVHARRMEKQALKRSDSVFSTRLTEARHFLIFSFPEINDGIWEFVVYFILRLNRTNAFHLKKGVNKNTTVTVATGTSILLLWLSFNLNYVSSSISKSQVYISDSKFSNIYYLDLSKLPAPYARGAMLIVALTSLLERFLSLLSAVGVLPG